MSNILDWRPDICLMDVCIGNDKGYEVINCLKNLGAVSYTHLDVYKRQDRDSAMI